MKVIKLLETITSLAVMLGISGTLYANEPKNSSSTVPSGKTEKRTRKKKAEMCQECGKPEKECECHQREKLKEDGTHEEEKNQ